MQTIPLVVGGVRGGLCSPQGCFKCGAYFKHYKIFSKKVDGLKELKLICFCSRCRNELNSYKDIKSQLLDAEYQLFLLEDENVTQD